MNFIETLARLDTSNTALSKSSELIEDLLSIETLPDKTFVIAYGESQIRISKTKVEITHGYLQPTCIEISQGKIQFKYQDGVILDLDDVCRLRDFFFREQPTQTSGNADITPIAPIQYNSTTKELSIRSATSTQSGALSNSDWIAFNSKQTASPELAGISALSSTGATGVVFRSGVGSFNARNLSTTDISGLGTIATQNSNTVAITGGTIDGVTFTNSITNSPIINNATINNSTIGQTTPSVCKVTLLNIATPNTGTVPLTINTLNAGANTLEVRRQDNTLGFAILNSGSIEVQSGSFYRHSGNQVVGSRRTGWTAATGTATRTTFATSTATTLQVAERLKGLIDDLITHGLIGS